jgi:hypothetical protein
MNPFFYGEEAGAKGLPPLSPAPPIPADPPPLCSGQFRLTIPNHYCPAKISEGHPNPLKISMMTHGRSENDLI